MSNVTYGTLLNNAGFLAAGFVGNQIAAGKNSLTQSQLGVPVTLGTASNQVEVPGMPGRYYVRMGDPGCRSKNFIVMDASQSYAQYPAGTPSSIKFPPNPGGRPTPLPPQKPKRSPTQPPYTPPINPPPPGSQPYYPPSASTGTKNGVKLIDNCQLLDTYPYGEVNIGGMDITSAILACASAPCGYLISRANIKYAYSSYASLDINPNVFDPGSFAGGQQGQGDSENYLYIEDAKGVKNYAALQPVSKRDTLVVFQYWEGIGSLSVAMRRDTASETYGPVKVFAKAHDMPAFLSGKTGRVALWLTGIEYEVISSGSNAKTAPLDFNFQTVRNSTQGWAGVSVAWSEAWGGTIFFYSTQYQYPVYLPGGIYISEVVSRVLIGSLGSFGFGCFGGGPANVVQLSSVDTPEPDGFWRRTQTWNVGEGLYTIGASGTAADCRQIKLS